jgi:hypothetical protein
MLLLPSENPQLWLVAKAEKPNLRIVGRELRPVRDPNDNEPATSSCAIRHPNRHPRCRRREAA